MSTTGSNNSKQEDTYVPPTGSSPAQQPRFKTPSRRTKLLLLAATLIATVGFNLCRPSLDSLTLMDVNRSHQDEAPEFDWFALEPAKSIQWTSCYSGHKCARLLLPLDHGTPDGPTTAIALRLLPAKDKKNYKGTILINPGGPGGSGTSLLARAGQNISRVVGDSFDILGFDPRGIGASTPSASCFETESQRKLWNLQRGPQLLNISDSSLGFVHAREKSTAQRCAEKIGGEWGIARFMSTPDVARDMLEIVQQLGQEKLQYWGFSYGSILGQYFASIYPDKVGRVIIDGVYDAHNYRAALWNSNLVDMEAVIDSFFTFCHQAGPDRCALHDSTPEKIRARYFSLLSAVEAEPFPLPGAEPPVLVTRKVLQGQIFGAAYKPLALFGLVADIVRALETRNTSALTELAPKIVPPTECECNVPEPWRSDTEAFNAVACGDGDEHPYDAETYAAYYTALARDSPLAAPYWAGHYLQCAEWTVRPKWRWTGPLEARNTSHPLLIVSPRYDPVCPLADARAVHARFGGAGLLVQNSYGHCSLAAPSLCTAKHVRAYMVNGTLPEAGTECDVDELPFVGAVKDVRAMSTEDAELLEAMRGLSAHVPMFGAQYI
ncbi:alpha/beta-hydrolase [Trametes elegans]|nr:alpha/beta-hydrolase [Trametes elegans]